MTSQNHVKRLEIQSHQRRDLCLYSARNGGPKTGSGGGRHHPPTLLGLIILIVSFPFQYGNGFFLPHGLNFHNITNSQVFLIKDITFSSPLFITAPIRECYFIS